MTEYQVLQQHEAGVWTQRKVIEAASAEAAIRSYADGLSEGGAYVAIPKRSFQPVLVEVETVPRVKIVGAGNAAPAHPRQEQTEAK